VGQARASTENPAGCRRWCPFGARDGAGGGEPRVELLEELGVAAPGSCRWRRRVAAGGGAGEAGVRRLVHGGHRGPAGRGRASKESWKGQDLVIVETGPAPGESYGMDRGRRRGGRRLDGEVETALVWTA
jgi:hypothetical protein